MMASRYFRVLPNDSFGTAVIKSKDGKTTTVNTGSTVDVPQYSAEVADQGVVVAMSGTTSQRPNQSDPDIAGKLRAGTWYIDTTLAKAIMWTGQAWRDPVTGTAV